MHTGDERPGDDRLDTAVQRADLDELIRLIDAHCEARDWDGLLRLRDRARSAVRTGRQLWPAATLAEYRLALLAPADQAAIVIDEDSGRFAIGPLTEVIAQHHTWTELRDHLPPGPRAALVAHERVLRGEAIEPAQTANLPEVLDIPYSLGDWEPRYCLATYTELGVDFPSRPPPRTFEPLSLPAARHRTLTGVDPVEEAVRQLVEPWTASSNGHCDVVTVEGDAAAALSALGITQARLAALRPAEAVAHLAWAGASGGAHGRRRGAATGRFGAWWLLAAFADALDDWPLPSDEVGEIASDLRWWWFDAGDPATGWQLQLVVEDPDAHLAWAIGARDAS